MMQDSQLTPTFKVVITVDLDDTLIETASDYVTQRNRFARFSSENFDISFEKANDIQLKWSRELLDEYGLSMDRFPEAMRKAMLEITDEDQLSDEIREKVTEMGYSAYLSRDEYEQRGFMPGSKEFLDALSKSDAYLVLLTSGDKRLQNRKIDALNLQNYFDEIKIVGLGDKKNELEKFSEIAEHVVHIGNSRSSDVEAAENACVNCIFIPNGQWREDEIDVDWDCSRQLIILESIDEAIESISSIYDVHSSHN